MFVFCSAIRRFLAAADISGLVVSSWRRERERTCLGESGEILPFRELSLYNARRRLTRSLIIYFFLSRHPGRSAFLVVCFPVRTDGRTDERTSFFSKKSLNLLLTKPKKKKKSNTHTSNPIWIFTAAAPIPPPPPPPPRLRRSLPSLTPPPRTPTFPRNPSSATSSPTRTNPKPNS